MPPSPPLQLAEAERDTCSWCPETIYTWWDRPEGTLTVQHGESEARRTFKIADVCTHGYRTWLAEVHEYERQRFLDNILAEARERGWSPPDGINF